MYLYVCLFTPSATCPVYTIVTSGIPREYISTLSRSFFYDTSFPVLSQLSRYSFHSPLFQSMNIVTFFIPLASFSKCHKCHDLCSAGLFNIVSQLSPSLFHSPPPPLLPIATVFIPLVSFPRYDNCHVYIPLASFAFVTFFIGVCGSVTVENRAADHSSTFYRHSRRLKQCSFKI